MAAEFGYAGIVLALGIAAAPAQGAGLKSPPQSLRQTTECMLDVLKTVPNVSEARLGLAKGRSVNQLQPIWTHPFLRYVYTYPDGRRQAVRFDAEIYRTRGRTRYGFSAALSGLSEVGVKPADWGTREITDLWKAKCSADAFVVYI